MADPIALLPSQVKAFDEILHWYTKTNVPMIILAGKAGVGKTTLTKFIAQQLRIRIALTAPTNQAVKVLNSLNTGLDCMTIYSLLGLQMREREDLLVLEKAETAKDTKYSLVVLDEGSMVGSQLTEFIKQSIGRGVRYLVMMDRKQINPIGERVTPLWKMADKIALSKVIRHDNAILREALRTRAAKRFTDLRFASDNDKREGVWYLSNASFENKIKRYAELGLFKDHETKVVAWRNKTVDFYNKMVRKTMFGADAAATWLPEDNLVITQPYETDTVKMHTDDTAIVVNVAESFHPQFEEIFCYNLTVNVDGVHHNIRTLHEAGVEKYFELLEKFAHEARTKDRGVWRAYWALKTSLASCKHSYGMTVHRVQGSTKRNIFIPIDDIFSNSDEQEALRCFYTAETRPTTKLFLT